MAGQVGVAGVVAALSVTSDLTRGHPPGEAMRACLLATELARRAGLESGLQGDVFYASLMRFAGCAATSHESAAAFGGDDVVVRARGDLMDPTRPAEAIRFLAGLGHGSEKLRVLARAPRVAKIVEESARADCEVGADLTQRLGLSDGVRRAVLCAFERFDGKGSPSGLAGADISEAARYAAVAFAAVMFDAVGGADLAMATVARWSGRALIQRLRRSSSTTDPSSCGCRTRTTCGAPWSIPNLGPVGCSATRALWTTRWPASVTPLISRRRSSKGTRVELRCWPATPPG